jgi:hypothetical protein
MIGIKMNRKTGIIIRAIGATIGLAVGWVAFMHATLLGLIFWYASTQMGIALIASIILLPTFFSYCIIKYNEVGNSFLYISLAAVILLMLLMPVHTERFFVGAFALSIAMVLFWMGKSLHLPSSDDHAD